MTTTGAIIVMLQKLRHFRVLCQEVMLRVVIFVIFVIEFSLMLKQYCTILNSFDGIACACVQCVLSFEPAQQCYNQRSK